MSRLQIAGLVEESIVDGPGVRFVVFVQGCPHHCKGCHNPDTHPFDGGRTVEVRDVYQMIRKNTLVRGVTFSGGEPFCQAEPLAELGQLLRRDGYDIFLYSGYTLEKLLKMAKHEKGVHELLSVGDYLVDGPFVEELRDLTIRFRGSKNQVVYDITCYPNSTRIYPAEGF